MDNKELNSKTLEKELGWLQRVIETRFNLYFDQETNHKDVFEIAPPNLSGDSSVYANFIRHYNFSFAERLLIILAITPHLKPSLLDGFFIKNEIYKRGFTEFEVLKELIMVDLYQQEKRHLS